MDLEALGRKAVNAAVALCCLQLLTCLIVLAVATGTRLLEGALPALVVGCAGSLVAAALVAARMRGGPARATAAVVATLVLVWIAIAAFGPDTAEYRELVTRDGGLRGAPRGGDGPGGPSAMPFVGFLLLALVPTWFGRRYFTRTFELAALPGAARDGLARLVKDRPGARSRALGSIGAILLGVIVLSVILGETRDIESIGSGVARWAFRACVMGGIVGLATSVWLPDEAED